jgi:hypothetical protein
MQWFSERTEGNSSFAKRRAFVFSGEHPTTPAFVVASFEHTAAGLTPFSCSRYLCGHVDRNLFKRSSSQRAPSSAFRCEWRFRCRMDRLFHCCFPGCGE